MTDKLKTESGRSLPQAPTFFERTLETEMQYWL
jgi:hypothetical protein